MSLRPIRIFTLALAVLAALCLPGAASAADSGNHIVVFQSETPNPEAARQIIARAGGELVQDHLNIGVAVVKSDRPFFVTDLSAHPTVLSVGPDIEIRPASAQVVTDASPLHQVADPGVAPRSLRLDGPLGRANAQAVTDPTQARLYDRFQWYLRLMNADDVWAMGHLGDPDVTVVTVDSGIDYTHEDLVGKVDLSRSVSFVPEDDALLAANFPGAHPIADLNFHGTFVAGSIACNAVNTACVAPNVTLVGVKVLDKDYTTNASRTIAGIQYAASLEADVISLAFCLSIPNETPEERASVQAIRRAVKDAFRSGAFVVAEAGIDQRVAPFFPVGPEGDADADGKHRYMPAQGGAVTVSATDINDDWSQFNRFGYSLVDLGAPGGSIIGVFVDPINNLIWGPCSTFTQTPALAVCQGGGRTVSILGSIGATANTAGVAALVDSLAGGDLNGRQIQGHLFATSVDVIDPGFDAWSGHGRVDALNAVTTPLAND